MSGGRKIEPLEEDATEFWGIYLHDNLNKWQVENIFKSIKDFGGTILSDQMNEHGTRQIVCNLFVRNLVKLNTSISDILKGGTSGDC